MNPIAACALWEAKTWRRKRNRKRRRRRKKIEMEKHYGSEQPDVPASCGSLFHELGSK